MVSRVGGANNILSMCLTRLDLRSYKVFKGQLNGKMQDAYSDRKRYESLADPKYIDTGAIFDIMAYTVIQQGLEFAQAA